MLTYHVQQLTPGQHTPSYLIPLHNKRRTHKKKASCTSPRGVAHQIHLPPNCASTYEKAVRLALLYVTRLTRPNKISSLLATPYPAYHHVHHIYRHTKPNNQGNNNTDNIKCRNYLHTYTHTHTHTHTHTEEIPAVGMEKRTDSDSPAYS